MSKPLQAEIPVHPPGSAPGGARGAPWRWALLIVLLLAAILIPFLLFEQRINQVLGAVFDAAQGHPWIGAAVIVGLLAGDVALPVPSSLVSTFAGAAYSWAAGAAIIWVGMVLGCLVAYALGSSAGRFLAMPVVGEAELARANRLFADAGPAMLIVARAVPVLAEASALSAGAARMPFIPFLVVTSIANAGIAAAYAATGAAAASSGSFLIVFLGLATVPAIGWTVWRVLRHRRLGPS